MGLRLYREEEAAPPPFAWDPGSKKTVSGTQTMLVWTKQERNFGKVMKESDIVSIPPSSWNFSWVPYYVKGIQGFPHVPVEES